MTEHESGQTRIDAPGDQLSAMPLPDAAIPSQPVDTEAAREQERRRLRGGPVSGGSAFDRLADHLDSYLTGRADAQELTIDLLASLRHFADVHAVDFAACDAIAARHYVNEKGKP